MNKNSWSMFISELRNERRYWTRQLRSKSFGAILEQGYSRGRVKSLDHAIAQSLIWKKAQADINGYVIHNLEEELKSVEARLKDKAYTTDEPEAYMLGKKNTIVYHLQLLNAYKGE